MNYTERVLQMANTRKHSVKHGSFTNELERNSGKQTGLTSKRHKSLLQCVVCDGDAHGYNFDAITCESCKAFFRRNAQRTLERFKCSNDEDCDVSLSVKKRCKRCRLQKCLTAGMRKEWILSESEKNAKRFKIEENRHLRLLSDSVSEERRLSTKQESKTENNLISGLSEPLLTDFDWFNVQHIQTSFTEAVKLNIITGISSYPSSYPIESTEDLLRVPFYISAMRLISYVKKIDEFQQLDRADQCHLVRTNLLTMCFFHSIFIYDPRKDSYHEQDTNDPSFAGKEWIKTFNQDFHIQMKLLRNNLLNIFQSNDTINRLVLLILFFSHQMSSNQSTQCSMADINSRNIFHQQNVFTDLLYKYCLHEYGYRKACLFFARYVHKLMELQKLADEIKFTIDNYADMEKMPALIQTLFN